MPTEGANAAQRTPFTRRWEGRVTLIEYEGRPVVVAREFGAMLEYADDGRQLVNLVTSDWSGQLLTDIDTVLLTNGRLAAFKALCATLGLPHLVDKRAPSLLLLTESGVNIVLAKSEKPQGIAFRRWLVDEVIPAYHQAKALPEPDLSSRLGTRSSSSPATAPQPLVERLRILDQLVGTLHAGRAITAVGMAALGPFLRELARDARRSLVRAPATPVRIPVADGRRRLSGTTLDDEQVGLVVRWRAVGDALSKDTLTWAVLRLPIWLAEAPSVPLSDARPVTERERELTDAMVLLARVEPARLAELVAGLRAAVAPAGEHVQ